MNQKIKKIIKYFLVLVLAGVSVSALAQWTPPSATPPGGNIASPVNTGSSLQEKLGSLVAGALQTNSQLFVGGSNFRIEETDSSPNAGFVRFGDNSGWKLHFGRSKESSSGSLNTGTTGALLTIQDNGRVGIGNTSPSATLDVNGTIRISGGNPSAGKVLTSDANGLASWVDPVSSTTTTSTSPWTVSGNNIFNSNTGNVGIGTGTTAPSHRLQVNGNIALQNSGIIGSGSAWGTPGNANSATLQLYASNGDTVLNNQGYNIDLRTGNATRALINSSGLEVNGTVKITGGSPGAGKVLTSDANGLASWQAFSGGSGWTLGSNTITSSNNVISSGSSSGFKFNARTTGSDFQWYSNNNIARLYAHTPGSDVFTVDNNGNVNITGNLNVSGSFVPGNTIKITPYNGNAPACNETSRGSLMFVQGVFGLHNFSGTSSSMDQFWACVRTNAGSTQPATYGWRKIAWEF